MSPTRAHTHALVAGNGSLGLGEHRNDLVSVIKTSRATDTSSELLALALSGLLGSGEHQPRYFRLATMNFIG